GATRGYLLHENHQKTAVPGEMPPALCPVRRWGYLQASAQGCMPHPDAVTRAARNAQASPPVLPFLSAAEAFAFSLIRLQSGCFYSRLISALPLDFCANRKDRCNRTIDRSSRRK